jgi:uncharacterized protein YfbU (UPF0304 family)
MDKVTLNDLTDHAICDRGSRIFQELFGNETEWNEENLLKVVESGLNPDWIVLNLLTPEQRKEYRKQVIPIKNAYQISLRELTTAQKFDQMVELDKQHKIDKVLLIKQVADK